MGKSKIKIQKIEKESNRRVTFNKRRIGLLKKAYEISILCEVDIALIFFAQNGEMTCFEGPRSSVEEVVMKFANTSEHEREKSHIHKYTTVEDQLQNTMPRKIENEEMFQEVARKLYQSRPRLNSFQEPDRSNHMDLCHHALLQEIIKEIKDIQHFLGVYDLNMPIGNLISSNKDATQMELYVQEQLQRLQNCKVTSSQLPASWLDSEKNNIINGQNQDIEPMNSKREYDGAHMNSKPHIFNPLRSHESTYMHQEFSRSCMDNNPQISSGWEEVAELCSGASTDQNHLSMLPDLSESNSDFPPSSIEDDIDAHDFLEAINAEESLQKTQMIL